MTTRYNFKWTEPPLQKCPYKEELELVTLIEPISFNDDKTVKEYKEKIVYKSSKVKWCDFIASYDLGSVSEQVINHITKGTPLVTAHVLPAGDYSPQSILKGAEIVREMRQKGITLDMIEEAYNSSKVSNKESEAVNNG